MLRFGAVYRVATTGEKFRDGFLSGFFRFAALVVVVVLDEYPFLLCGGEATPILRWIVIDEPADPRVYLDRLPYMLVHSIATA
jgi:hypothetical protein